VLTVYFSPDGTFQRFGLLKGGLLIFVLFFFHGRFWMFFWVPGSMLSCFSASLLLCFLFFLLLCVSTSLLFCFSAFCFSCFLLFLLLCFSCFFASLLYLLLFFSASLLSLLLCFSASVPFYFYYSTCSFLQSPVLLLYFLHLCFSASCLCFFFSFALFSPVSILNKTLKTLGETQRNLKEILIRTRDKKPLHETLNEP